MPHRVLLVEDEAGLALTLGDRLRSENYQVEIAHDGEDGLALAAAGGFGVILLDWMLPRRSGIDICRELRRRGIGTPILMLTARGQTLDKVVGLKLGADDYLTKPFEMPELLARVEALLRRANSRQMEAIEIVDLGAIRIDRRRHRVTRSGEPVDLAPREYKLLCYFLDHADRTISREELLKEVWSYRFIPSTRTVDVHVGALRQKLEDDPKQPKLILTVQGQGYCLGSCISA
jgi:two-component system, OmpR family, alkaline phosphatase synthesis response regulator PhoP